MPTGRVHHGMAVRRPSDVSTANYDPANPVSNGAQLPLSADGALCIFSLQTAHVVLDVNGWWS